MNHRECTEWLNTYIKTDQAHKVITHHVFGHNGDCGDYGDDWMWLDDICKQAANLIESLAAQLEQVTKERDAAIDKLRGKCAECINEYPGITHLKGSICENCVFNGDCYTQAEDHWQWRGVQ